MKRIGDILESYGRSGNPTTPSNGGAGPGGDASAGTSREAASSDDTSTCPICRGKGYLVFDVPPGHPDFSRLVPCRCTQARIAARRAVELRALSNLGSMERLTFDNFMPDGVGLPEVVRFNLRAAYDLCHTFALDPKGWIVLLGGYGCGKTHLAAAIANHRIALGYSAVFVVVPDLLDHLRSTYAPNSVIGFDDRIESIRESPLLVLDDLGSHNSTPWAQEKLFQILNARYNSRMPTVITTNQRLEELDPRITSRLVDPDLSQPYEIIAPDFRQPGAERGTLSLSALSLHTDKTFESFSSRASELSTSERENLRNAITRSRSFAEEPSGWLVLSGTFGCGKTHLAAAIANHAMTKRGSMPMFVVVPDLLDHLRATFSPSSQTTLDKLFEQVKTTPLLVLDDLGTESATPWAREKLFQLLNHRYEARLATVITTSDSIDQIEPRLRTRMLDATRCTVFAINVPSYRGSLTQAARHKSSPRTR